MGDTKELLQQAVTSCLKGSSSDVVNKDHDMDNVVLGDLWMRNHPSHCLPGIVPEISEAPAGGELPGAHSEECLMLRDDGCPLPIHVEGNATNPGDSLLMKICRSLLQQLRGAAPPLYDKFLSPLRLWDGKTLRVGTLCSGLDHDIPALHALFQVLRETEKSIFQFRICSRVKWMHPGPTDVGHMCICQLALLFPLPT